MRLRLKVPFAQLRAVEDSSTCSHCNGPTQKGGEEVALILWDRNRGEMFAFCDRCTTRLVEIASEKAGEH